MSLPKQLRTPVPDWRSGDPITANKLQLTSNAIRKVQAHLIKQVENPEEPTLDGGMSAATYVASETEAVEIKIYDVADPETEIGTATQDVYTSITWRITSNGVTDDVRFEMPPA